MTASQLQPLVSVIVPAFNAEKTLAETLASIAGQSWTNLEIIIVDDGSTDSTGTIAEAFVRADARARVISIANSGVATARNTGAAAAGGMYLAPIDADDVWHPLYLGTVIGRMRAASKRPAFGYTPCRIIDPDGRVIGSGINAKVEGTAVGRLLYCNFVGNGSAMVIDRTAFEAVGGYDPRLHAAGLQGCEDYLLQLMLASRGTITAVGDYLVGYRQMPNAMSRDLSRMNASGRLARRLHRDRFPRLTPSRRLHRWIVGYQRLLDASASLAEGSRVRAAASILLAMIADPWAVSTAIWGKATGPLRRRTGRTTTDDIAFRQADPKCVTGVGAGHEIMPGPFVRLQLRRLERLATADEQQPALPSI